MADVDPEPAQHVSRFDWERMVRGVDLPPTVKLCGLIMATYADRDGSRIRPGVAMLAVAMCVSEPTAKRSLSALRDAGLVARTRQGNRHTGEVDEYRLTVPAGANPAVLSDGSVRLRLVESGDHQ